MESRQIYESNKIYQDKVKWIKPENNPGSEWVQTDLQSGAAGLLNAYFNEDTLYLVLGRNESEQLKKNELIEKVAELFGKDDFLVWNRNFERVIEFNKIGVYRQGKRKHD